MGFASRVGSIRSETTAFCCHWREKVDGGICTIPPHFAWDATLTGMRAGMLRSTPQEILVVSNFIEWSIHLTFFFLEALAAFAFDDFSFLTRYCDYTLRSFPTK